ncbi:hypothetical protein FHU10_1261 [Serratia fonticola]|uniref:Uncharacterized protein n=1 Tax=Serratia fonticola TaxID=47917 RepID=A0A542D865_SERFO|nr:DUF6631 family protein [Serratia fonticola]TQI78698.1 hypothetical protein FHU09_1190 [Serratia fonticola]TQI99280.1 hypothetical protein FHU11_4862 [Serratia fonticola]TVZ68805.1 hypothetical protein FHU10_1261 [Serratia fonticola]
MAKKIPSPPVEETEDDLSTVLSTRDITIAGNALTIREFNLIDSLVMHDAITPVVTSLTDVMETDWPSFEDVQRVLARHADVLPALLARCIDRPVEWVASLPASEGTTLMDWWWSVNRRFFMNAVVRQITLRAQGEKRSGLAASSQHSSGQATTPTDSVTTPTGK